MAFVFEFNEQPKLYNLTNKFKYLNTICWTFYAQTVYSIQNTECIYGEFA